MKRCLDIAVSVAGLLLLSPVLLILALLIATTSTGGPFFSQTRVGRDRPPFKILKFRSMTIKAENEHGGFDAGGSARITPRRLLRRTKLDELPQLWNVLVRDMSLVGSRPEVPEWTLIYPKRWERVLIVRPGLTDLGSILIPGRGTAACRIRRSPKLTAKRSCPRS
jgi:lipopolysaccharide/colanic/teichoic acid biosynthesis glycosyltransferase